MISGEETAEESEPSEPASTDRRSTLKLAGGAVAGVSLFGASHAAASDPEPEIRFDDQESDGTSFILAYAATDADAFVVVGREGFADVVGDPSNRIELGAGDTVEDVQLHPDSGVLSEGTHELTARLQESNGGTLATDDATVRVEDAPEITEGFDARLVEADPEAGFSYPYFLYAPDHVSSAPDAPVLVEPNNTGTSTDDFDRHLERARGRAEGGAGVLADRIDAPLVVPVFPRPQAEPVDWTHYVHQLDDTTMGIDGGPLERVDRQLLRMVEDARAELAAADYPVADGIMLNGFSASGNFADRFAVLHPREVVSVTAGGLNGMAILPAAEREGRELPYHVGVANVESLTGEPFDPDALDEVNQFLYMGAEDDNDTIPYDDAWTDEDLRELALDVYGEDMVAERFPTCQEVYREAGIDAAFRVYEGVGHTPRPATDDIVEVHRRSVRGEDIDDVGDTLVATIGFDVGSAEGGAVEFDAGQSDGGITELTRFLWDFGDGHTAFGETVTHEFAEPGEYRVALVAIADDGTESSAETVVSVGRDGDVSVREDGTAETDHGTTASATPDGTATADGAATTASATGRPDTPTGGAATATAPETETDAASDGPTASDADDGTAGSGPGFGVVGALAGIGGAVHAFRCRFGRDTEER
ncbi:PKD domain-containing protein [Halosimplex rubrum]|uniref:PKD domain-containing protein n=1 Tax=Halosimplex rubrum TaxID=869889 RepID=A0A7D5P785_9EURY|nr:PKD domain-containing protein [Halosimplex rubrum]QLH79058.1 PKD domain-containing protein [Halosimplex rubrum]